MAKTVVMDHPLIQHKIVKVRILVKRAVEKVEQITGLIL